MEKTKLKIKDEFIPLILKILHEKDICSINIDIDIEKKEINADANIVIRPLGVFNKKDFDELIKSKKIKASVLLSNALENVSTNVIMLVLSKDNTNILFADLQDIDISKLNDEDIEKTFTSNTDISILVNVDEVLQNDIKFKLNPIEYLPVFENEFSHLVKLGDFIKNTYRGIQVFSRELNELKENGNNKKEVFCLTSSDIKDDGSYFLEEDKLYFSNEEYEKISQKNIKNLSLIMTRLGNPNLKTTVFNETNDRKIFAQGNLIVIEFDLERVNPYYIQAMFMSSYRYKIFKKIAKGSNFMLMSARDLYELKIPLPSIEIQNVIANEYERYQKELSMLYSFKKNLNEKILNLFDEKKSILK